tara:strand:- start:13599 stop:14360 length:762 start_codon:yes stop_codon:yes gene_type:complete
MREFSGGKLLKIKVKPKPKGFILYDGPSILDGKPIAVIATLSTSNRKTGPMIQTWIIRSDMNPVSASKEGEDSSICGSCPHKHNLGGACYVNIGQAPLAIFKAYKRGVYPHIDYEADHINFVGRMVRLGAYGDPAAMPYEVAEKVVSMGRGHTGYTHQIRHKNFDKRFLNLCMVSADTPKQALKYQAMGAKTFRVALENDSMYDSEIECLSESEGLQCDACGLCNGQQQSIAIKVHGSRASKFKSKLIETYTI